MASGVPPAARPDPARLPQTGARGVRGTSLRARLRRTSPWATAPCVSTRARAAITSIPGADSGRARSGREGSGQQDRPRARRNLSAVARGQALIWFNARHDGITLEAVGDVTLTAANPDIADPTAPELSRGRQSRRVFRRRHLAQDRAARLQGHRRQQLHDRLRRQVADRIGRHPQDAFFYADGGGIKIYARSYPDDRTRRGRRQLHQPVRRRRVGRAPRADAGLGAVPRLHLPQQPHADHRLGGGPAARQPRRRSRTACSSATSPTSAWTTSGC